MKTREWIYVLLTLPAWCWSFLCLVAICKPEAEKLQRALNALRRGDFDESPATASERETAELNRRNASKIANHYGPDGARTHRLAERIFTELQIAQKRGEILAKLHIEEEI